MIHDVEFPSEGAILRGRLYLPDPTVERPPVVVMAHGTSATIHMAIDAYAEVFQRAGLAVLLYDHHGLGRSGGEPRRVINPWIQCRGYLAAIDFVAARDDVDADRIALWGDSYTGGQVVAVAAVDARVKAVVAQCPVFGAQRPALEATPEVFEAFREVLLQGDVSGTPETTVGPLPVVSFDPVGLPSLLEPVQAFRWFMDYGGRPGSGWANRIARVIPPTPVPYHPALCAPFVTQPKLVMVAPEDEMVHANYAVARAAYDLMPEPKRWYDIAGGHFGLLYVPSPLFDEASGVQAEFLVGRLAPP